MPVIAYLHITTCRRLVLLSCVLYAVLTGELALAVPCLGASQQLLNKDHREAYYTGMPQIPGDRWVEV